jgi:glycosyltransferase involved in cell wall biosynthesis
MECRKTQGRETLSVLVLAKNEEQKIASCLERVKWADEILVVDDMSTDRTAEICSQYGAKVVQRRFDDFANQANYGLEQLAGDWVLSLDADELVTPALRDQIQAILKQDSACVGFTFKRLNYFLGHCMR